MISTATRTTATVSPLSPLTNGNAVAQSNNSGFAAALRKLAKQAEDPRGKLNFRNTLILNMLITFRDFYIVFKLLLAVASHLLQM